MKNTKIFLKSLLMSVSLINLLGCAVEIGGPSRDPRKLEDTKLKRRALNEVKYISPKIVDPWDSRSVVQPRYIIDENGKLLLRLSGMSSLVGEMLDEQPILLKIVIEGQTEKAIVEQKLRMCPLMTNWMMLATWQKAHPYKGGRWRKAGGDIDTLSCQSPLAMTDSALQNPEENKECSGENVMCFDMRPMILSYIRERGIDFGFALINDSSARIEVSGDGGQHGPRIIWRVLR